MSLETNNHPPVTHAIPDGTFKLTNLHLKEGAQVYCTYRTVNETSEVL